MYVCLQIIECFTSVKTKLKNTSPPNNQIPTNTMNFIDISSFINTHITKRDLSMFQKDLDEFNTQLTTEIASKSVLVIGGAGTIGSSFIKAL